MYSVIETPCRKSPLARVWGWGFVGLALGAVIGGADEGWMEFTVEHGYKPCFAGMFALLTPPWCGRLELRQSGTCLLPGAQFGVWFVRGTAPSEPSPSMTGVCPALTISAQDTNSIQLPAIPSLGHSLNSLPVSLRSESAVGLPFLQAGVRSLLRVWCCHTALPEWCCSISTRDGDSLLRMCWACEHHQCWAIPCCCSETPAWATGREGKYSF